MRTKWMDPDFRREPKTARYCVICQRDLAPERECREVRFEVDVMEAIHPEDWKAAEVEINARRTCSNPFQRGLVGMDCARRLGLEWTAAP